MNYANRDGNGLGLLHCSAKQRPECLPRKPRFPSEPFVRPGNVRGGERKAAAPHPDLPASTFLHDADFPGDRGGLLAQKSGFIPDA